MSDVFASAALSEDEKYADLMTRHQLSTAKAWLVAHKDSSFDIEVEALAVLLAAETLRGIRLQRRVIEGEDVATVIVAEFGAPSG